MSSSFSRHCSRLRTADQPNFMCTKQKCEYVVLYPSRYFQGRNEQFKDTLCNERKCFYFTYPYRYFQTNRPTVTGILEDSEF